MKQILSGLLAVILLSGCAPSMTTPTEQPSEPEMISPEPSYVLLIDDPSCRVEFVELFDYADVSDDQAQDLGVCYIRLLIQNNTETTVTAFLDDLTVNDLSVQAMSAVPMELAPGAASMNPFSFSYSNLPISEKEAIESIRFSVVFFDDAMNQVFKTDLLNIPF